MEEIAIEQDELPDAVELSASITEEVVEPTKELSAAEFVADLEMRQDNLLEELSLLNARIEATLKEFAPSREYKEAA